MKMTVLVSVEGNCVRVLQAAGHMDAFYSESADETYYEDEAEIPTGTFDAIRSEATAICPESIVQIILQP